MHWLKEARFHAESRTFDDVFDKRFHFLPFFLHLFRITTQLEEVKVLVRKQYFDSFGDKLLVQFFILLFKCVDKKISVVLDILSRRNLVCLNWLVFALFFEYTIVRLTILRIKLLRVLVLAYVVEDNTHARMLSRVKVRVQTRQRKQGATHKFDSGIFDSPRWVWHDTLGKCVYSFVG